MALVYKREEKIPQLRRLRATGDLPDLLRIRFHGRLFRKYVFGMNRPLSCGDCGYKVSQHF